MVSFDFNNSSMLSNSGDITIQNSNAKYLASYKDRDSVLYFSKSAYINIPLSKDIFKDDVYIISLTLLSKYWHILLVIASIPYLTQYDIDAGYNVIHSLLMVAGLIGFAYAFPKFSIKEDISYGIFLYHMIIVNIFIHFGLVKSWLYAFMVIIITVTIASISNQTIGVWSVKRKSAMIINNQNL